jgi:hypothetical protein
MTLGYTLQGKSGAGGIPFQLRKKEFGQLHIKSLQ